MKPRDEAAMWLFVIVAVWWIFVLAAASGCAHERHQVVVLPERIGGPVADILEAITGQEPKAVAAPGLPTVVLQPADASDPCLIAHETAHRRDQVELGAVEWTVSYLRQLTDCERDQPRAWCLRNIPLEAEAYAAQHRCQAGRAKGAN